MVDGLHLPCLYAALVCFCVTLFCDTRVRSGLVGTMCKISPLDVSRLQIAVFLPFLIQMHNPSYGGDLGETTLAVFICSECRQCCVSLNQET